MLSTNGLWNTVRVGFRAGGASGGLNSQTFDGKFILVDQ